MSFGWSAGDIFTLVVTCYKIVENCREGLTSASIQLGGLQNDLEEFSAVLLHLHNVVKESQHIAFFDMKEMKKTIVACNVYLTKYAGLKRKASFSKGKELLDNAKDAGLKIKQAVIFTTLGGDQELQVLQRRLARHRQTLVLYLQILERYVYMYYKRSSSTNKNYVVTDARKKISNSTNAYPTWRPWSKTCTRSDVSLPQAHQISPHDHQVHNSRIKDNKSP